jgi:ABC-2 type transport system ATP-binding protein
MGELFAFRGPKAAGKTTTIKMLAGLIRPTSGRAWVGGYDVQVDPMKAKAALSFVPDFPFLYDKLKAIEFLHFVGEIFEVPRPEIARRAGALMERFDLVGVAGELTENLSHGTRQRVAIAAALLHDPEVIIIDEPMVGLDPIHARTVKDELKDRSRAGATVFLSTHQLAIADEMADRIGVIHQGRLIALGSAGELRAQTREQGLEQVFIEIVGHAGGV